MARIHRSVRIDPDLLAQLEQAARDQRVPATFGDQVDVGLRLLLRHADDTQARQSARLVAADHDQAETVWRQLGQAGRDVR